MKVRKKIGAIAIVSMLLIGSIQVVYANSVNVTMAGVDINASSSISTYGGYATTTYGNLGSTAVSATYNYKHYITGNHKGSYSNSSSGVNVATVSFSAPSECVSESISASHSVSYQGQYWSGYTYN